MEIANELDYMDDTNNIWGTQLVRNTSYNFTPSEESFQASYHKLCELICKNFEGFFLDKIFNTGSDANRYAILECSNLNVRSTLFAVGSYIVGDNSALQQYSTIDYKKYDGFGKIISPFSLSDDIVKHVCVLPYFIPGACSSHQDRRKKCNKCKMSNQELESKCLAQLIVIFQFQIEKNQPISSLFLELMLAGNGAILSNKFLIQLANACKYYNVIIIVDEILTFGRTCTLFYTQSKPEIFQKAVGIITCGKWIGCGMAIRNKNLEHNTISTEERGVSTHLPYNGIVRNLELCIGSLQLIAQRRRHFHEFFNINAYDSWGEGLIVFTPEKKIGELDGIRCRYLLQLENNPFALSNREFHQSYIKCNVQYKLRSSLEIWIEMLEVLYILI